MNGWTNQETWNEFTIISNTEWQYDKALKLRKISDSISEYSKNLSENFGFGDTEIKWEEIAEFFWES